MKTLRETEPFAYGFMNSGRNDIGYSVASGLFEFAKNVPLNIETFVSIPKAPIFGVY